MSDYRPKRLSKVFRFINGSGFRASRIASIDWLDGIAIQGDILALPIEEFDRYIQFLGECKKDWVSLQPPLVQLDYEAGDL